MSTDKSPSQEELDRMQHHAALRSDAGSGMVWIGLAGDSLMELIHESRAKILQPPTNKPWAYEIKIADPDGNVICLGAEPKE